MWKHGCRLICLLIYDCQLVGVFGKIILANAAASSVSEIRLAVHFCFLANWLSKNFVSPKITKSKIQFEMRVEYWKHRGTNVQAGRAKLLSCSSVEIGGCEENSSVKISCVLAFRICKNSNAQWWRRNPFNWIRAMEKVHKCINVHQPDGWFPFTICGFCRPIPPSLLPINSPNWFLVISANYLVNGSPAPSAFHYNYY